MPATRTDWSFELCAETAETCRIAEAGGATRIELCARLDLGGTTPNSSLVAESIATTKLPIHAMVRPRGGDFHYTAAEIETMQHIIADFAALGVAGVVFGLLHDDGTVDEEQTLHLVSIAKSHTLETTFHRAIDESSDPIEAVRAAIRCGIDRVLTSGGKPNVIEGLNTLKQMQAICSDHVTLAAGGGVTIANTPTLISNGLRYLHGRLTANGPVRTEDVRTLTTQLSI